MKNLSDDALWKSLKEGNLDAFSILFKNYYSALYNYGLKISRNIEITEDSLQDFFLYVYEHKENLSDLDHIAPYLFSSYRRFIIKMLQKKQKNTMVRDIDENIIDIEFTPEEIITNQEAVIFKNKHLSSLLNKLPKRQREVLYLKYYCNLKASEISEVMSINYQSVVNTIHKAINNLRQEIDIIKLINS